MDTLETIFEFDSALVFGLGGSGDVVGSVPTARMLELHGLDVTLGGVTWEPVPYDSVVGPRSLEEVEGMDRISRTVALASGDTRTRDGLVFKEALVADHLDADVVLIDVSVGLPDLVTGLDAACERLDVDVVVGVDVGSDVLARGDEPGLRTPVIDGLGLVTLEALSAPACLGVFGYGSDGELSIDELESSIARAAERGGLLGAWGLTPRVAGELRTLLAEVDTTASRLPVEAAEGRIGRRSIRGGDVSLELTPPSTVTFYFDPGTVAETSGVAERIRGTTTLKEAVAALHGLVPSTEFAIERDRLERGEYGDSAGSQQ